MRRCTRPFVSREQRLRHLVFIGRLQVLAAGSREPFGSDRDKGRYNDAMGVRASGRGVGPTHDRSSGHCRLQKGSRWTSVSRLSRSCRIR
jgi:hypothetical protein